MLKFRDHDGLTFKVYECADFRTPVVSTAPHFQDREAPGRVGWIQKGKQGGYWMGVLRGVALELIRRYEISVVVHPGEYGEGKTLHVMRIVMGQDLSLSAWLMSVC